MAMENEDGGAAGGWWGSWMNAAKAKSAEVYEFVKNDLNELSTAVKSEASAVLSSTSNAVKETLQLDKPESTANTVKRSVSSFFDQVGTALSPPPEDGDEEAIIIQGSDPVFLNRLQTRLYTLASEPRTFTEDIKEDQMPQFEAWLTVLEEDKMSMDKMTKMLAACPPLQENYTTLVPTQVSHAQFWHRYLFRKGLIEDEEAARERKEEREKQVADSFQWDKELSEEEQIRILAEYEAERKMMKESDKKSEENGVNVNSAVLIEREKKDMIIVSTSATTSLSTGSTGDKESNDDDWEREFDLDETEASSPK
ncbi:BSD domain-containing protein 1-like isoform X2 [Macrosteles quadrilineatus]|uniref:BSD domain-containing protein 1-like isoform X2 n=1 Tax=Macrosteles quadrilineatus TaxID=74068 RepID=UPI0023E32772|nr:BSD domain-containing protein 1-like isoform X2 [Macrosteles quadrilineatus]XP_054289466.1 BSD domain-containing protein 1-like isoform X2 [Macrosteles quadrilineatus]